MLDGPPATFTFPAGAFVGGRIAHSHLMHRGRHLLVAVAAQAVLVVARALRTRHSADDWVTSR